MAFLDPPEQLQPFLDRVRDFVEHELLPLEDTARAGGFEALENALDGVREKARAADLWAPALPRDYGGLGLSLYEFAFVSEVLGRSPLGHYALNVQAPDIGNMEILMHFGSDAQRERWLKPLIAGDIRSCFSMTEPELAGSNPTQLATRAVRDGDDWVINGHKWFTTAAEGAAFAIVMAVTNPEAGNPYGQASQIIVPTNTPGFELVRNLPVMGERGSGYASHAEIRYNDCRVPYEHLLGGEGAGFAIAQERLGPGRIHHCMRWLGIAERAFELMCSYAAKRELRPGKPLGTRQIVQDWIATSRVEIDAARLLTLSTAAKIDAGGAYAARQEISLIKFYVAGVLNAVLDRALQTHGGLGMTDDTPLAYWFRHERAARIYDGPDEVHKSVVARRILEQHGMRREAAGG